jgi:protease secretion system outer membrane protein
MRSLKFILNRISLITLAFFLNLGSLFFAPNASALTLKTIYELALENDPEFKAAIYEQAAGNLSKELSLAALRPSVSASAGLNTNSVDRTFSGRPTDQLNYQSKLLSLTIRQPIVNLDAFIGYKQGIISVNRSEKVLLQKKQYLLLKISEIYLDLVFLKKRLIILEDKFKTENELKAINDNRFRQGEGTKLEILESQTNVEMALAQIIEVKNSINLANEKLKSIIGQTPADLIVLCRGPSNLPLVNDDLGVWERLVLDSNPEVHVKHEDIYFLERQVERTKAGHAPSMDLVASYSKNSSESVLFYGQDTNIASIGVSINIPIYRGGFTQASTRQAVELLEKARAELIFLINEKSLGMRKNYYFINNILARIKALSALETSYQEARAATFKAITSGSRSNVDLLRAEQQLFSVSEELRQASYAFFSAYVQLHFLAGQLNLDVLSKFSECD